MKSSWKLGETLQVSVRTGPLRVLHVSLSSFHLGSKESGNKRGVLLGIHLALEGRLSGSGRIYAGPLGPGLQELRCPASRVQVHRRAIGVHMSGGS